MRARSDNPNQWGVRIESALVVRHVQTKREFNGPIWLGFERLTCVPISTRMVDEGMLTKEEKTWLKVRMRMRMRLARARSPPPSLCRRACATR